MQTDIATRAMVVALMAPSGGAKTTIEIHAITGLPVQTIRNIYAEAIRRGFEPNQRPLRLINAMVEDTTRHLECVRKTGDLIVAKAMIDFGLGSGSTTANIASEPTDIGILFKDQNATREESTSKESDWEDEEE
ncbi:hypothetical protein F53441_6687 [Fusarium austroafricanum]|uniref:Uncharacterized protein n=1 Tax=Fusarium austroafricanum TaxID=2364996 RepID=A0A8H4KI82_9HYPO|nr:hypothetical protein F53441_6687 [Fusarium austroafricanum]